MPTIYLDRTDVNSPLHPFLWEQLCEELNISPEADTIAIRVAKAEEV